MPLAFVTPSAPNVRLAEKDISRLSSLVFEAVGNVGIQFITVPELPRTQTGKILRSLLRALIKDERLAFLKAAQSIRNPGCLRQLHTQLKEWREVHHLFRSEMSPSGMAQNGSAVFATADSDTSDSAIAPVVRPPRRASSSGRMSKGSSNNGSNPDLRGLAAGQNTVDNRSDSSADRGLARRQHSGSRRKNNATESAADQKDSQADSSPVPQNGDLPVRRNTVGEPSYQVTIDARHLAAFTAAMTVLVITNIVLTRRR